MHFRGGGRVSDDSPSAGERVGFSAPARRYTCCTIRGSTIGAAPLGRLGKLLLLNAVLLFLWATQDIVRHDVLPLWRAIFGGDDDVLVVSSGGDGKVPVFKRLKRSAGAADASACAASGVASAAGGLRGARNISGDDVISFNVIMTSNGDRPTLQPSLESILPQLAAHDYFTLISDENHLTIAESFANAKCNCTKLLIQNSKKLGWWGHGSRSRWQKLLPGTYHMNADDDDLYLPNAMSIVRHWVRDLNNTMFVFRMIRRWDERIETIPQAWIWNTTSIKGGTIGTPCVVYRADRDRLPDWTGRYGGDGDFYKKLKKAMTRVQIVPEIIYHVGQREDLRPFVANLSRECRTPFGPDCPRAEPEHKVLERREWRKHNPDAPPQFLPSPKWVGDVEECWKPGGACRTMTTNWEPPEDAPTPPSKEEAEVLSANHAALVVQMELDEIEERRQLEAAKVKAR